MSALEPKYVENKYVPGTEYRKISSDPRPFRSGKVRAAQPGWLNGQYLEYDPRPEYGHTFEPVKSSYN